MESTAECYTLLAALEVGELSSASLWRLGLSAVIEETNGRKSYWALAHPPGKPERRRTKHFPSLAVPALFVQGTVDPFGSPGELRAAIALIPTPTRIVVIDGAGHDLRRGRFDLAAVAAALLQLTRR